MSQLLQIQKTAKGVTIQWTDSLKLLISNIERKPSVGSMNFSPNGIPTKTDEKKKIEEEERIRKRKAEDEEKENKRREEDEKRQKNTDNKLDKLMNLMG